MASVISNDRVHRHTVDKYNFKVLATGGIKLEDETENEEEHEFKELPVNQAEPVGQQTEIDSSAMSTNSKDALIESLMKKTDDMSSNFIKLQMKLEAIEEEHKRELVSVGEESFNKGMEEAKNQVAKDGETNLSNTMSQYASSVSTLEESAKEYESALEGIKANLITAALDIAKEVVNVELDTNANNIAQVLSSELIKELQSASKITLKVNPNDHGVISQKVGSLDHVEIISDGAVSEGGVIAMSDAGNIDAQISKRFERVKRAALSE